jgi:hypothetical protein
MDLLADVIFLIHILIFVFLLIAPFSTNHRILLVELVFILGIIVHWWFGNSECCLTVLEKHIRNEPGDTKTIFGRIFGTVYTFGNDKLITQLGLLTLFMITLYRIKITSAIK